MELFFDSFVTFFGNAILLSLNSRICINDVSMALMFENLFDILMIEICETFYGIRSKRFTKSTHFFVIAFNCSYTSDNIAIGPDVCFPEARDTHTV